MRCFTFKNGFAWKNGFTGALLLFFTATALCQEEPTTAHTLDLGALERVADLAREGADPQLTASIADESRREEGRTSQTPPVLVSKDGDPAFVYTRGGFYDIPEGRLEFVMSCRGDGIIDLSVIVSQLLGQPWDGLDSAATYELHFNAYGQDQTYMIPVRLIETFPSHQLIARMGGSAPVQHPFFDALGPTTNLSYQLKHNGQVMREDGAFITLTGGIDLSTFHSSMAPLLTHCRAGNANPLNRVLEPSAELATQTGLASPTAGSDDDIYQRCAARPSQACILTLAQMAQRETQAQTTQPTEQEENAPDREQALYEAYIAAYRGEDSGTVLNILTRRYGDEHNTAQNVAGSILAEVGRVDAALAVLVQIDPPFQARPGNIQSPPRRRFETAYLQSAEWMLRRGDNVRTVLRALNGRLFTLNPQWMPVGTSDSSKLALAEMLSRTPEKPDILKMFTYLEGTNEATRDRAWAINFIHDQNPITATQRSVMEALRAADPTERGALYVREMMATRMAAEGNVLHAYLLVKDIPSQFRSGLDVHLDVLGSMESLIETLSLENASSYIRWAMDKSVRMAGSATSLAAEWAKIAGILNDIGQTDAAQSFIESSETMFHSMAHYPGRTNAFTQAHGEAYHYLHVLGASGWEGRALMFIREMPQLDQEKALVELLRGMSERKRKM